MATVIPRWLQGLVALGVGCFIVLLVLGSILVVSSMTRDGEAPFTAQQKIDIAEQAGGGTYISASLYRYCGDDSVFWYVDSERRLWTNGERCASWIRGR